MTLLGIPPEDYSVSSQKQKFLHIPFFLHSFMYQKADEVPVVYMNEFWKSDSELPVKN